MRTRSRRGIRTPSCAGRVAAGGPAGGRRERGYRRVGVLLLLATIAWLHISAAATGGSAAEVSAVLGLTALAFVLSDRLSARTGRLVPLLMVVAGGAFALFRFDALFTGPLRAPLGYSNAAGALFFLLTAASILLASRVRSGWQRAAAACAAAGFALVPLLNETRTAAVLLPLLPAALLAATPRAVRMTVAAGASLIVVAFATVVLMGASYRPADHGGWLKAVTDPTLSERRLMLWNDALGLFAAHPLTGVGPGRFDEASPTARADRDTSVPHSEPLHFAAESGLPGLVLLLATIAWPLAWLWHGAHDRGAAVAALAYGGIGVHANVDYILHFPAVPIAAAALVAAGVGGSGARSRASRAP